MKTPQCEPFYAKGLQFECLGCSRCCTGFPGYVYLSERDIELLSEFLRAPTEEFIREYTRAVTVFHEARLSLVERSDYSCIFWKERCTVYPARPYQCRTFPFWKRQLVSKREWEKVAGHCPGVNRGRAHSKEEIERCVGGVPNYDTKRFSSRSPRELRRPGRP